MAYFFQWRVSLFAVPYELNSCSVQKLRAAPIDSQRSRRPGFDPRLFPVRFVAKKVALLQVFLPVLRFSFSVLFLSSSSRHCDKGTLSWELATSKCYSPALLCTSFTMYLKLKVHSGLLPCDIVALGDKFQTFRDFVMNSSLRIKKLYTM